MKRRFLFLPLAAALCIGACEKENEKAAVFKPEGYWRGSAYLYHTAIINSANGRSRLYFRIPVTDTANAHIKLDGSFTVNGNSLRGVYGSAHSDSANYVLEGVRTSTGELKGSLIFATGELVSFELKKQP